MANILSLLQLMVSQKGRVVRKFHAVPNIWQSPWLKTQSSAPTANTPLKQSFTNVPWSMFEGPSTRGIIAPASTVLVPVQCQCSAICGCPDCWPVNQCKLGKREVGSTGQLQIGWVGGGKEVFWGRGRWGGWGDSVVGEGGAGLVELSKVRSGASV